MEDGATRESREQIRTLRDREYRNLQMRHQKIVDLDNEKADVPFSAQLLKENLDLIGKGYQQVNNYCKRLQDTETEEGKQEDDEIFRQQIVSRCAETVNLGKNLQVWREVSLLIEATAEALDTVDSLVADDPTVDTSGCLHDIKEQVAEMNRQMKDFSGLPSDPLWTNVKSLRVRLVRASACKRPVAAAAIVKKEDEDFKIPKINIPKFKGGLESWHGFWSRFKVAVHENEKLSESVKLAVLIDVIADPTLNEYLVAANDGQPDRYRQVITYLKSRFDRPKELHALYCKKLVDLPANKGTPAELSQAADTVFAAVSGIRRSGQTSIDAIATSLIISTLPSWLRMEWENKTESEHQVPNVDKWIDFMRKRAVTAEHNLKSISSYGPKKEQKPNQKSTGKVHITNSQPTAGSQPTGGESGQKRRNKGHKSTTASHQKCTLCSQMHFLFQCGQFLEMTVTQRNAHVLSVSFCPNCLKSGHTQQNCSSTYTCRVCHKKHNTLLHTDAVVATVAASPLVATVAAADSSPVSNQIMMTSQVFLTSSTGKKLEARAMLDTGAAVSVLSKRMMNLLQVRPSEEWMTVSGIESPQNSPARPTAQVRVTSKTNPAWSTSVKVVILPRAARNLPENPLPPKKDMPHLDGLVLADSKFNEPRRVDMILDVGFFNQVLLPEKLEGPPGTPSAWKTELGWGVMGCYVTPTPISTSHDAVNIAAATPVEEVNLTKLVEKFWLLEEMPKLNLCFSSEDIAIQKHYETTHYFSKSLGRYVVSLPRKETNLQLGESYRTALNRFMSNERSLLRKGNWDQFQDVIKEYIALGHAQLVTAEELCTPDSLTYHLPMHAVYKQASSSTKIRVVFDGSCPTSTGASLNDILAAGPTLHPNLDQILIKFRSYGVALSADITKMYN